jgi:glycosyltransferase involved in cell wall biosynthesis
VAELAERKGVPVRFVDQVPHTDMRRLYAEARVVAVPSHFESFSIAALEAMATGRPIVYTSRVGAAEILRGTDAGAEVPPGDPEAMARALRPYLLDPAHAAEAGRVARTVAQAHCRPDIIAEQRERCFEDALSL